MLGACDISPGHSASIESLTIRRNHIPLISLNNFQIGLLDSEEDDHQWWITHDEVVLDLLNAVSDVFR